ncbi:Gfo/Idh/MocA family oxidoreductase [Paraflavitalea speifideaquila]|uniref:Gfo/Idh/MocA family protein n=1 Tax=Paraflavitalea speifideaquila TaxID=3076558 RepID=UPI0028EFEDFE|nr:Gfo/Idh/MocA family oxidoreductase [Paraflavitalea speifideiaquila]
MNKKGALVAVCDTVPEKADKLATEYGAKAYYSIDELLKGGDAIDVLSVCSPNGLHAQHAVNALNAGFHVLCEKPMALSVVDCGEMIKAAERSNKRLFAIKQNRFNPR